MQDRHLYEYAVIRVVPKVEREEFFNVGLILFSKKAKYIRVCWQLDEDKLKLFSTELDIDDLKRTLHAFECICNGAVKSGYIGSFDIPERFRWLTAVRSACVQTSRPHPGLSENLDETFEKLYKELVL